MSVDFLPYFTNPKFHFPLNQYNIDTIMANVELELPPFFPELDFDSRFEYSEYVKKVSADSGTINLNILVQTNSYPVTLTWEINPENGINYSFIGDSGLGKITNIENVKGKTAFNTLENNKIKMWSSVGISNLQNLPTEFILEQNYPNPFNPTTIIKFAVPKESHLSLSIFNLLGEKVKELKNEIMKPGFYQVEFDASSLASGIYFYSISTNNFHHTKKMILIK